MKTIRQLLITIIFIISNGYVLSQVSGSLNANQKFARDIFAELIGINTTERMGSTKAAEAMAEHIRSDGFPDTDIHIIGPRPEHMNLEVRYRGNGTHPTVLFIGHPDVVEALMEDWSFDPFRLQEKDGYFYGRGTTDMTFLSGLMKQYGSILNETLQRRQAR